MAKLKTLILMLVINLISVSMVKAADISIDPSSYPSIELNHTIIIRGEIMRGDYEKLINVVKRHGSIPMNIWLDSRGGDVIEAMKIGRFVRRALLVYGGIVPDNYVQTGCHCYSACIFIYVACVERRPMPTVSYGIHRPHFDKSYFSGLSAREAELKYNDLEKSVRKYLEEMNVPQLFVDRIFSIPSNRVEVLDYYQLISISGASPPFDEWIISQCPSFNDDETHDLIRIIDAEKNNRKHTYSSGYVKYLKDKHSKYFGCKYESCDKVRNQVFRSLK